MTIWYAPLDLPALTAACAGSMPGVLGIEFVAAGDDWLRARMPVDQRTRQPYGRLHGGASVALAETVASVGAMATLDPARAAAVGMEINANHLRPVGEGFVHATATCEASGRTSQVWTIRIVDDAGRLVCLARMTAAVIPAVRGEVG
ncbi:MAG: esterase [Sphingomonas taxi]|uniref:Esterase n=1 Tax=Sphingomonas taxi TaxID=1549858 RepID=A0A2W5R1X3_9SPHN|nr:MAG: esterase [Sphingomonas taxi]